MRRSVLMALWFFRVTFGLAWTSEAEFTTAATNALVNRAALADVVFTNNLDEFIRSSPSTNGLLSAKLVEVASRLELFEQTHDESALTAGLDLASNRVQSAGDDHAHWQSMAARLLLVGGLCLAGEDARAFSVATNALVELDSSDCTEGNDVVAQALLRYHDAEGLNIYQTIQVFAALTAAKRGEGAVATNFVRALPMRYQEMVPLILSARGKGLEHLRD